VEENVALGKAYASETESCFFIGIEERFLTVKIAVEDEGTLAVAKREAFVALGSTMHLPRPHESSNGAFNTFMRHMD
jgi:hypothetical protein